MSLKCFDVIKSSEAQNQSVTFSMYKAFNHVAECSFIRVSPMLGKSHSARHKQGKRTHSKPQASGQSCGFGSCATDLQVGKLVVCSQTHFQTCEWFQSGPVLNLSGSLKQCKKQITIYTNAEKVVKQLHCSLSLTCIVFTPSHSDITTTIAATITEGHGAAKMLHGNASDHLLVNPLTRGLLIHLCDTLGQVIAVSAHQEA